MFDSFIAQLKIWTRSPEERDFHARRDAAMKALDKEINSILGTGQSQKVNPYDTGRGADMHNTMVNQRAKRNASVDKDTRVKSGYWLRASKALAACNDQREVWLAFKKAGTQFLSNECFETQGDTSRVNWNVVYNAVSKAPYVSLDIYLPWKVIYQNFWE